MLKSVYEDVLFYNHVIDIINGGKGMYGLFSSAANMQSYKIPFIVNIKKFTKKLSSQNKE